jgi:hypothetical protein
MLPILLLERQGDDQLLSETKALPANGKPNVLVWIFPNSWAKGYQSLSSRLPVNPSYGNSNPLSAAISKLSRGSNIRSGTTRGAAALAEFSESSKPPVPLEALTRVSTLTSGLCAVY